MDICTYLEQNGIAFERFEHPAVFTCEEAERLLPDMPGAETKNVFLRDKKGERHFLVVVGHDKRVDLKALGATLDVRKLSLASPERLREHLGVEPGSVTVLGLVHDRAHAVELLFDRSLWESDAFQFHPLVNTATVILSKDALLRFLAVTGHEPRVLDLPGM